MNRQVQAECKASISAEVRCVCILKDNTKCKEKYYISEGQSSRLGYSIMLVPIMEPHNITTSAALLLRALGVEGPNVRRENSPI